MPRKTTPTLTDGELRVMEVLWPRGEASVRAVTEQLSKKQTVAYSTALTMLRILHKKGYVTYRKEGRAFIYRTLVNRREARKDALRHLMHRFFGNSPTALARTKQTIWESLDRGLDEALANTWEAISDHVAHPDLDEGAQAFVEKRKPNWAPYTGE